MEVPHIEQKLAGSVHYSHLLAYVHFHKKGIVQKLLHELKYNHKEEIGTMLGRWFGHDLLLAGFQNEFDIIVPVPLHPSKLKKRGYEPNDFGLYNMAGNVSEWVNDTYRPLSFQDFDDLNPVRKDGTGDAQELYGFGENRNDFRSLINDRAKVFKGGSWKDVAYWMSPGTRRFLDQDRATNTIGFRCAMISIGFEQQKGGGIFGGK